LMANQTNADACSLVVASCPCPAGRCGLAGDLGPLLRRELRSPGLPALQPTATSEADGGGVLGLIGVGQGGLSDGISHDGGGELVQIGRAMRP